MNKENIETNTSKSKTRNSHPHDCVCGECIGVKKKNKTITTTEAFLLMSHELSEVKKVLNYNAELWDEMRRIMVIGFIIIIIIFSLILFIPIAK